MAMCADHLGNQYESFEKMCRVWGTHASTVRSRMKRGYSLQESLTMKRNYVVQGSYIVDAFGNKFRSTQELKKHWNIK